MSVKVNIKKLNLIQKSDKQSGSEIIVTSMGKEYIGELVKISFENPNSVSLTMITEEDNKKFLRIIPINDVTIVSVPYNEDDEEDTDEEDTDEEVKETEEDEPPYEDMPIAKLRKVAIKYGATKAKVKGKNKKTLIEYINKKRTTK